MKFTVFLVPLVFQSILASASADDEYFQKSVFQAVKDQNGQFRSQSKFIWLFGRFAPQYEQDEKFSFKTGNGLLVERMNRYPNKYNFLVLGGKEIHSFSENRPTCYSFRPRNSHSFPGRWAPVAFDADHEFKIYGKLDHLASSFVI